MTYNRRTKPHDLDDLKSRVPIEDVARILGIELERRGGEYKALCPFHSENTPSFSVIPDKGFYHCFGCGEHGDALDLIAHTEGLGLPAAADRLAEMANMPAPEPRPAAEGDAQPRGNWTKIPAPRDAEPPKALRMKRGGEWREYPVVAAWPYLDSDGNLLAYTCRIEPKPGRKDVIPVTWQRDEATGKERWKQGALDAPRPLYGADVLAAAPKAAVVVVEGEKAADAARRLLAGVVPHVVTTWPGGGKGVSRADWSLLAGRAAVIWPDADLPGLEAAQAVAAEIIHHGGKARIVMPPAGVESGWDLADAEAEGWTGAEVMDYARANMRDPGDPSLREWPQQPAGDADLSPRTEAGPGSTDDGVKPPVDAYGDAEAGAPVIDATPGNLANAVRAGIAALRRAEVAIYDRGGALVRTVRATEAPAVGSVRRDDTAMVLRLVTTDWARLRLADAADWIKYTAGGDRRPTDPPADVARTIAEVPDAGAGGWPRLRAMVSTPVLWPDGTWSAEPGYHGGLLVDVGGKWPEPGTSRTEAEAALRELRRLLRHYSWATSADESVAVSLLLSAVLRPVLETCPLHAADAPAAGSGKTLLIDAAATLGTGARAAVLDWGRDPVEAAKRLDSLQLAGDAVIALDNIVGPLDGAALCQSLTQPSRRVRPLGASVAVTVPCTALITATGNNLLIRGDVVRRSVVARIDPRMERPEQREIPQDLIAEVTARRRELVAACQTIARAYILAGTPALGLAPLGSFADWSRMVRSPLVWLGMPDPASVIERTRDADDTAEAARAIMEAWFERFGVEPVTATDAVAKGGDDLRQALEMVASRRGTLEPRLVSYWLRAHRDALAGDLTLRRLPGKRPARWTVRREGDDGHDKDDVSIPRREKSKNHNGEKISIGEQGTSSPSCPSSRHAELL